MAQYQWAGLGSRLAAATPGVYINNAQFWSNVGFFPALPAGALGENSANSAAYWPYDRIVFSPSAADIRFDYGFGAYCYQQDVIYRNSDALGSALWTPMHTCNSQDTALDSGVHTGLYTLFGRDGYAYVAGMYAGAGATEVGGVSSRRDLGTWNSAVTDVGAKFTGCTYPLTHRGRLWLATQGSVYAFDPATLEVLRYAGPSNLNSDPRDKLFSIAGRLFLVGTVGIINRMNVWEFAGGSWIDHGQLPGANASWRGGAGSEWGILQSFNAVYVIWGTGGQVVPRGTVYHSVAEIVATAPELGSALTFTNYTADTAPLFIVPPYNVNTSLVVCAQESDAAPASSTGNTIWCSPGIGGANPFSQAQESFRWAGTNAPFTRLNGNRTSEASYTSSSYGLQDTILYNNFKVTPFRVRPADDVKAGAVRIDFWAFGPGPTTQSVRLYLRDRSDPGLFGIRGTKIPVTPATPLAPEDGPPPTGTGATLNAAQKRIDNVQVAQAGLSYTFVWDRVADLGDDPGTDVYLNLLMADPGLIPSL